VTVGESTFEDFEELFAAGRAQIARRIATRLALVAPAQLSLALRAGGAGLHEPLVHAWLSHQSPPIGLEQLLYGYLLAPDRPERLPVLASSKGVVRLPGWGALRLHEWDPSQHRAESGLELRSIPGTEPALWVNGRPAPAERLGRRVVPGTEIELHAELHPLVTRFFRQRTEEREVEVEGTSLRCLPALARAFALLARVAPEQRASIERDCRALVVLRSAKILSLATLDAYGLAVLSVSAGSDGVVGDDDSRDPSELCLAEDLVHQVGHISFFAITEQPCFTIPAQTPLARFTSLTGDHRTLYAAFHGNYTIMRMAQFFEACLERGALDAALRHELLGRFALTMTRFEAGLVSIDDERLYTPLAWQLHRAMIRVYERLDARYRPLLERCDLAGQPYVFDYRAFCARNPRVDAMRPSNERLS
jgi:hypothetical protein